MSPCQEEGTQTKGGKMAEEGLEGEEETKNNFETGDQETASDEGMGKISTK